jgi:DNA-binding response OmpR family regulator
VNVLVVEDDKQLAELLDGVFREEGHAPVVCGSLAAAEGALAGGAFDVVVLDRMLPDGDGMDLCARLRGRIPPLPVVMLTARGEVHDRVSGLRAGADDYVVKPFDVEELLARVDAVHRRAHQPWITEVGVLEIDRRAQIARARGRRLDLTAREYAILARLADCPEECVSRATLLADVWNLSFDPGSGVIDVHVSHLRDKLGELSWMVETVRGHGLRVRSSR